eukprot:scaffold4.g4767.t1
MASPALRAGAVLPSNGLTNGRSSHQEDASPSGIDALEVKAAHLEERRRARRRAAGARFGVQANALLRKNLVQQRRSWVTNVFIISMPVFFCVFLLVLQLLVNKALDSDSNKARAAWLSNFVLSVFVRERRIRAGHGTPCGCYCLRCCRTVNGEQRCRDNSPNDPCQSWEDCLETNKSMCGVQYSSSQQVVYCPVLNPSTWPAFMQARGRLGGRGWVPAAPFRARPWNPQAVMLYTGGRRAVADAIMAGMFSNPSPTYGQLTDAVAELQLGAATGDLNAIYASALSTLGLTLGSASRVNQFKSLYIEPAFLPARNYNATLDIMVTDNSTVANVTSLSTLPLLLDPAAFTAPQLASLLALNTTLQQAWDWQDTNASRLSFVMYYNATSKWLLDDSPPNLLRVNQGLNLAANAWLAWALGPGHGAQLAGLMDVPKGGSELTLEFSSLLGPLFYTWLLQLLLPVMLVNLVYEKERRLRTMMKMHGLGDAAYWLIMYAWFFAAAYLYTWILIGIGSAIRLSFFTRTSYSFQAGAPGRGWACAFVYYLLWTNVLVAWAFLLSTLFRSSKTAVVASFLYVFGTGLVGWLLLQQFVARDHWWVVFMELLPGFGLYRGLFEISQVGGLRQLDGLRQRLCLARLQRRSLPEVMIIFAVEWPVFLLLAWYLEQVVESGIGVPRHPLFFLGLSHKTPARAGGGGARGGRWRRWLACACLRRRGGSGREGGGSKGDAVVVPIEAEDVREERLRVERLSTAAGAGGGRAGGGGGGEPPGAAAIVIRDLEKRFPPTGSNGERVAVRGLTLAIERGECFGLLGPNGAGKSTTLNLLTGFLEPSAGSARVEGLDIRSDLGAIYALTGVCPQHGVTLAGVFEAMEGAARAGELQIVDWGIANATLEEVFIKFARSIDLLWERLTAREHLMFYGRLKSLEGAALAAAVDEALRSVNLYSGGVGDKQVRKYSGGMKRRLSVAISFIGQPRVVYLDEPSTGLDPASRHNLWNVVKTCKSDRAIILTTHSMEEATVLCDRLGIFVDGQLVCIGNPKELTARYGGYYVFSLTTPPEQEAAADALVRGMSPGARLTYAVGGCRKYEVPVEEVTLAGVFEAMEGAARAGELQIVDWGIANATLEEVFIKFARSIGAEGGG